MSSGPPPLTTDRPPVDDGPTHPAWRPSRVSMTGRRDPAARPRRGGIALPALAAGIGLALSLPPWGIWVLAFPAAGLLFWRLRGLSPRQRLWAGWVAGLGCYGPGLMWARAFTLPGALVLVVAEAGFFALAGLAVPAAPLVARALAFPGAMTLAEWARMHWPFGGLPLGGVFLGQAGGPVVGIARLGGPLGLTASVYIGGVGLGCLGEAVLRAVRDGRRILVFSRTAPDGSARGILAGAMAGLGGLFLAGALAVGTLTGIAVGADHAPDGGPGVGPVTVAAVQGGGARGFSKSQIDPAVVLAAQFSATRLLGPGHPAAHPGPAPALVLWPEDVVSLETTLADSPVRSQLAALARALRATLVVGVTETVSDTAFRNEIVAFGPDGTIVSRYEKVHRVPFGEYVPLRGFFAHLADLSAVPRDAVPGTGSGLLTTPAGPLGTMVSYEVFYADRGRSAVRAGAQLLIVPTNTSSYATAQVPTQEIAASEVQAVQQGRDLLQAAPTGYSAAVTHRGTLVARSVLGARQVVTTTLERRTGWTVYVRAGDLPVLLLAAAATVAGWLLAARRSGSPRRRAPRRAHS